MNNHEDKDASFFFKFNRAESTRNRFRNRNYLTNQQSRMRYDQYRCEGLPMTSSHIESTIKQINRRVKGSEKFWNTSGAEALLQLSADYLSETDPLTPFWRNRQSNATGHRHYHAAA